MKKTPAREDLSRRQFLKGTAQVAAGLSGVLALRQAPPVHAQQREVTMISWNHFVPKSDEKLKELAERFTKQSGVRVKLDHIPHLQQAAKYAAEVESQSGHDIVELRMHMPILHAPNLVDLSDLCGALGQRYGGFYDFAKEAAFWKDRWLAIPWYHASFPGSYNKKYFDQVGEAPPDTWEGLLRVGKKLKKTGHPIGTAISQCFDAISTLGAIMWCYGAKAVEPDGKTIAINSRATQETIEFVKALYSDAMEPEVLSWDDASNNRHLVSGKGSWIHNPQSHYLTAKVRKMPITADIYFHLSPQGPAGRHTTTVIRSIGIWKFSKQIGPAKEFLKFLFQDKEYTEYLVSSEAFNAPVFKSMEEHPAWETDPKYKPIKESGRYGHLYGWPAPGDDKSQLVTNAYIIPNMFAKAVTGTSTKEAMQWAEGEIKRIYG
jgi:multiple sugar transport system substrate-binding protein